MSNTVDQRVVEMRFDNKQFESGVSETLSTLDKFKQSLNFSGAAKGLNDVSTAAQNCDVASVGAAAEEVGLKFNAMWTIADQVLRNITNSAMATGKRIISAFTIDPVKTGFSEYETQMGAIQTILANTEKEGTTLDDVNSALDELNTYADKTIYNFTQMTRNIGTFTAAGVKLDTSVQAIKGIANLAAVSGSNSQQASTAMYQLSQAMASGTVKLMDWNSVVNAGMGGQVFQDALKETARVHGIAVDDIIAKHGSFRESLSTGWITTEILTETLAKFTGDLSEEQLKSMGYTQEQIKEIMKLGKTANDAATKVKTFTQLFDTLKEAAQSGWSQTWRILVGDFEEAKEMLTSVSDTIGGMIGASSDARNELLENWKALGGRTDLLESFKNIFQAIVSIVTPIKDAFRDIFPPTTAEQLFNITKTLKEFTAKLKLSDKASDNLKRTLKGIFAVLKIVINVFKAIFKVIGAVVGGLFDMVGGALGVTAVFGDMLVAFSEMITSSDIFNKTANVIVKVLKSIFKIASTVVKFLTENFIVPGWKVFQTLLEKIYESIFGVSEATGEMKTGVVSAFDAMGSAIENCSLYKVISALWNGIKAIAKGIATLLGSFFGGVANKLANTDFSGFLELINSISLGGIAIAVWRWAQGFADVIGSLSDFKEGLLETLDEVRGCFEAYQTKLKADALMKIAGAIAILTAALVVLSFIDSDRLSVAIAAITVLFGELLGFMVLVNKFVTKDSLLLAATSITILSVALLLLAAAMKIMSTMSWDEMGVALVSMTVGLAALVAAVHLLPEKKVKGSAAAIRKLCTALFILSLALKIMSTMSWNEMGVALVSMVVGLAALVAAVNFLPKDTGLRALGLVSFATAMVIFSAALKIMSTMSWSEMAKGLISMAVGLGLMVAAINLLPKSTVLRVLGLVSLSAAMVVLAGALKIMGSMSLSEMAKGLISMAVGLGLMVAAINLLPKSTVLKVLGLISLSTSLVVLASALKIMGSMSWESVAKGLISLTASIAVLTAGLNLMKSALPGAAALVIATAALSLLVPVLLALGLMSWESIAKGLVAIAGAFVIFGIAGKVLAPVVPAILGLAGAMALIGVGMLAFGLGLTAMGTGLAALAVGFTVLASSFGVIVSGISAVITGIILGIAKGIVAFCEIIIQGAPAVGEAIKTVVIECCKILDECVPTLVGSLFKLVMSLLDILVDYTPQIVNALLKFVIGIIDGLAAHIPELISSLFNLVGAIIGGLLDAFSQIDTGALLKGVIAFGIVALLMKVFAGVWALVPQALLGVLGVGIIIAEMAVVLAAIGALAQIPGLTWLVNEGGNLLGAIGTAIGQFIGGIVGGIAKGFTSSLPDIGSDLSKFMTNVTPFIEGVRLIDQSVTDGVGSLIGIIMSLTAASFLKGIASFFMGSSSIIQYASDLPILGKGLKAFSDSIEGVSPENVASAANAAKALAEMTDIIPNEGGMVSWFTGDNSLSSFAGQLPLLGQGLKGFSDSVSGVTPENIIGAANAAKALAQMTDIIPNQGGMVSWFTGDNSIANFGNELTLLGKGLKGFAESTTGINPEIITSAANAAKALAEMTNTIPNTGGVASWFAGENSIAIFSSELVSLGRGLKGFSEATVGVNPETVTAAANAAKVLAEMTNTIPNTGGMVTWFAGDNSVSNFSNELPKLGKGLKGFSDATAGINPETMTAAANAAKALAEMTTYIPNQGGMVSWFTGENSISSFSDELVKLGKSLKGFSDATVGIKSETMTAAANSAKALAEMTSYIPSEGGMESWFTGESSVANFADRLPKLGKALKGFSDATAGINPETMTASANAAKALAEMTSYIPKEGGIQAWFTGETSIANFADKLPALGKGLTGFSKSVSGINPENVTAAADAAKSLAQMTETVPKDTGKIIDFGKNLVTFSTSLATYFKNTKGISAESTKGSTNAVNSIKDITAIDSGKIKSVSTALDKVSNSIKDLSKVPKDSLSSLSKSLSELGKKSVDSFLKEFDDIGSDLKKAINKGMDELVKAVNSKKSSVKKSFTSLAEECAEAVSNKKSAFSSAGKALAQGLADGISANSYKAAAKAKAMAEAAVEAARKALDINSPSKVFRNLGYSVPEGMALGIEKLGYMVTDSTDAMTNDSIKGVRNSISRIADVINNDMDSHPTIRPVLDLSNVEDGANSINKLLSNNHSIGVMSNVGAINSMMDRRIQNGANADVVSAIKGLSKDIENNRGDTYNFGNVSYDDDSSISNAVKELVRAALRERRV